MKKQIFNCFGYPTSLFVVPHFVHLKKVIVEWMVWSAASTFQVSLWVLPHVRQTTLTVGSCLNEAAFLSMTAISAALPQCKFIFCFVSSWFRGFWYLHFGHLNKGVPFLTTWSNVPHLGQKFIESHLCGGFSKNRIFKHSDFYVTNTLAIVPFGTIFGCLAFA